MGLCVSASCSRVHEKESGNENFVIVGGSVVSTGFQTRGSLCSKQGSKGLNQDAAVFCQVLLLLFSVSKKIESLTMCDDQKGLKIALKLLILLDFDDQKPVFRFSFFIGKEYGMEEGAFCGVFDGHGKNGHIVSNTVKTRLPLLLLSQRKALEKLHNFEHEVIGDFRHNIDGRSDGEGQPSKNFIKWMEAVGKAFKLMDREIELQENFDFSCSGTTAVTVVKQGGDLVIANLGDSRAVLGSITDDGLKAIQLTTDLRPGLPTEADRITRCNGRIMAMKGEPQIQRVWMPKEDYPGLAMSRAFGDFSLKKHGIIAVPEISYRCLSPNDQFIILATDGVWDVLSNSQAVTMVWKACNEEAAAEAVVEAAMEAWKKRCPSSKVKIDDCTVVCLFLHKKR